LRFRARRSRALTGSRYISPFSITCIVDFMEFPKPTVVISRCIEFDAVRYDGQIIRSPFVKQLIPHIEYKLVCPEVEIGLGVPRETLRLVKRHGEIRLVQPSTGRDLTSKMKSFANYLLDSVGEVDGFIMKSRSPSSGLRDAKIYAAVSDAPTIGRGPGIFGQAVLERFSHLAVEDEGRLRNGRIREHFLRKLFTIARFRAARISLDINALIRFHTENKLLLKAYNQKELKIMGKIIANQEGKPLQEIIDEYAEHLYSALQRGPRCTSNINVLMNSMGYFSDELSKDEKKLFLGSLDKYRDGKLPLISPVSIMKSWIARFDETYLKRQTFFNPYPEQLMTIEALIEACGERDYWA